uniref:Uncharacterized protein n=1 Tax=Timema douglasi TaxID=61478 RepID=A0A7R8ZCH2_TIMDO|nr:unnamed protein product [Timema douglasi]
MRLTTDVLRVCSLSLLQNTYTNAEKLLTAAEELAQTGECNADEIYSVAHELESHVTSFAARVEQRRRRLDLTVLFYNREKEGKARPRYFPSSSGISAIVCSGPRASRSLHKHDVSASQPARPSITPPGISAVSTHGADLHAKENFWVDELRQELQSDEVADTLEAAERLVEQCGQQRDSSLDASVSTIAQGETLLQELRKNTAKEIKKDTVGTDNSKYVSERRRMREELRKMKTFY